MKEQMKNDFKGGKFPSGMNIGMSRKFQNPPARKGFGLPIFQRGKRVGEVTTIPDVARYNPKKPG